MSTLPPQVPVAAPDLPTLLDLKIREALLGFNCHLVGIVQKFSAATNTVQVSIASRLTMAGIPLEYPLLVDVPVFILGGGNRAFTFPIEPGDTCLVLFNDRDMSNWVVAGNITETNSPRLHDLSDGLALIGFRSLANPLPNYSTEDMEMRNGNSTLKVGDKILIKNSATDLLTALYAIITALGALNSVKVGGSADAAITLANAQIQALLKSS